MTDSKLFYRNDDTDGLFPPNLIADEATAAAIPITVVPTSSKNVSAMQGKQRPRTIDLPKHSPPKAVVQRQKMMLDLEMVVGRMAMVAGIFLLVNELVTGSSMMEQVSGLLLHLS